MWQQQYDVDGVIHADHFKETAATEGTAAPNFPNPYFVLDEEGLHCRSFIFLSTGNGSHISLLPQSSQLLQVYSDPNKPKTINRMRPNG